MPLLPLYNLMAHPDHKHLRPPTKEDFGYCLVMQSLGSGVGWGDDHLGAETLRTPLIEAWIGYDRRRNQPFYMEISGL